MTVPCEVQIYGAVNNLAKLAENIKNNTWRLEKKYNFYDPNSWLSQYLNGRKAKQVKLDDESKLVFQTIRHITLGTQGVFDPTVGSIKALLRRSPNSRYAQAYQKLKDVIGPKAWDIQGDSLIAPDKRTQFDLGGVIKEFAIDQTADLCHMSGAQNVLINFGGDIRAMGSKPNDQLFQVAVLNPKSPKEPYFSLPLKDAALTTSAHYERRCQFADKETSHILSEKGTHTKVLSVSVVAPTALEAGAISTALTIQPDLPVPENFAAIFIDDQLAIHQDTEFLLQ